MKKVRILGVAAVAVLALASCKKDYTCECTTSVAGVSSAPVSVTINDTKKNAEETCESGSVSTTVFGITSSTVCEIK